MKIGELFVNLGIKGDTYTLNKFTQNFIYLDKRMAHVNQSFNNFNNNTIPKLKNSLFSFNTSLLGVNFSLFGMAKGLENIISDSASGVTTMKNFNAVTDLSIDKLQEWQNAGVANLGLTPEEVANSIARLQTNLNMLREFGKGNFLPFGMYEIDIYEMEDAFDALEEFRKKINKYNSSITATLLSEAGLDPKFINILRLTREEFDKLANTRKLNKEERDALQNLAIDAENLRRKIGNLKDQMLVLFAPEIEGGFTKIFEWLENHKDDILHTIEKVTLSIKDMSLTFKEIVKNASDFAEKTIGIENAIKLLGVTFAAAWLKSRPFLTGVMALVFLFDQLEKISKGENNLFVKTADFIADKIIETKKQGVKTSAQDTLIKSGNWIYDFFSGKNETLLNVVKSISNNPNQTFIPLGTPNTQDNGLTRFIDLPSSRSPSNSNSNSTSIVNNVKVDIHGNIEDAEDLSTRLTNLLMPQLKRSQNELTPGTI